MKAEVAGSFLSWMWWILDPLLYMIVYTFVAVVVFRSNEPYFPVFVFIGLNTWTFFSKTVKSGVKLVHDKKSVVTKVYIPKFVFILEKEAIFGIKMFVSCALTIIFMVIYQVPVTWKALWVIPLWMLLFMITFAFTTIITHFGVFVEDLMNVLTVALQLGFYLSGIFYSLEKRILNSNSLDKIMEKIISTGYLDWLNLPLENISLNKILGNVLIHGNPIALIMTDMRNVLLYDTEPHYVSLLVWAVISVIVGAIGVRTIYKHENTYVKII
jgi:teichoic acid transport system permease protein